MLRAVDLFCGCGGLTSGLRKAGIEVALGADKWEAALSAYRANNPDHEALTVDFADVEAWGALLDRVRLIRPDLVAGGPPCQDFATCGGREEGERAGMTPQYASFIASVKPRAFIMENVPRARLSVAFAEAVEIFRAAGYGLTLEVLDASLYGVPQKRKRMFLVGVLGAPDDFLKSNLLAGRSSEKMTPRKYFSDGLGFEHYYVHPRTYDRRGVYSVDEPAPTMRGVARPLPFTYAMHKDDTVDPHEHKVRALTPFERSRIQTFPEDYCWPQALSASALNQMIGNAVPVELGRHVAQALVDYVAEMDRGIAVEALAA